MDLGLAGKTALVTGGGRGIGRAIALALAGEGVRVAIAGRSPEEETLAEIRALSPGSIALTVDVSQEAEVVSMVASVIAEFGQLDLFVNNAGAHWHESVTRLTAENVDRTLDTNLKACLWACRETSRHMLSRGTGSILIVASTIQYMPGYTEAAYRISKVGLRAFAETLALELGPSGIRVNVLSPGLFPTKLGENLGRALADQELGPRIRESIPMRRVGDPSECGPAATFLLSDLAASYITGADLTVDGGFHLRPLVLMGEEEIAGLNKPQ
jgi:NAD(P)-dependent dehydrogenase (short-subunit alcohol dehydrogenase family)